MPVNQTGSKYGYETTTGLVIQQGLFEESEDQKHKIDTCVKLADGRCFHYAQAGAVALSAGKLNKAVETPTGHEDVAVLADVAIGGKLVTVTEGGTTPVTKNQYAEGYLSLRSGTGVGQMRKIRSHPAAAIGATVELTLYDPFTTAIVAADTADLIYSPYQSVVENATLANPVSGVPLIAVQASYFFWNQTFGPANVLNDGGTALGTLLVPDASVAGAVETAAAFTGPIVGWAMIAQVGADYGATFLTICP
jgi:hypothetical protein